MPDFGSRERARFVGCGICPMGCRIVYIHKKAVLGDFHHVFLSLLSRFRRETTRRCEYFISRRTLVNVYLPLHLSVLAPRCHGFRINRQ